MTSYPKKVPVRAIGLLVLAIGLGSCAAEGPMMPVPNEAYVPYVSPVPQLMPYIPPAMAARTTVTHEVAPLESLWRLGKMYDVPKESIMQANHLSTHELSVGQKLIIPNAAPLKPIISLYPNNKWRYIVIHHTASESGNALMVDQWHLDRGFVYGLGYHFLIDNGTAGKLNGQIETSPRWIKQENGAHCKAGDMNTKAIGIALVGNFSDSSPSSAQMESLGFLVKELMNYYNIPESRVIGHRDAPGATTECPGYRFPWQDLKHRIR